MSLRDEKRKAILLLRLIASDAELLAMKLEKGETWGGDYQQGVMKIQRSVGDLPEER